MRSDTLAQLRAVDRHVLSEIVRQDQRSPAFEIMDWTVERLSSKGIVNPDGLFRFSGSGRADQAIRPWSIVLKILHRPEDDQDLRDIWYWKRELHVAQSRLLERLPGPVVAPRIYTTVEHGDSGWLWMEHIGGSASQPWTLGQYAFAARELGRFNGAYLTGEPRPDEPWLAREHCRWWLATLERCQPDRAWDNRFVRGAFTERMRPRVERLWDVKEHFLAALTQVPQVFSHFDYQRRNLFIRARADGTDEVVAVDWAWVGIGPLGGDLFSLIGSSTLLFEVEPEVVAELEAVTVDAYLAGLRDVGWGGNPDLVRLGYSAWLALFLGACAPTMTSVWTADERAETPGKTVMEQFGRGPEAVADGWATLCAFALAHADEACQLMDRLQLG